MGGAGVALVSDLSLGLVRRDRWYFSLSLEIVGATGTKKKAAPSATEGTAYP